MKKQIITKLATLLFGFTLLSNSVWGDSVTIPGDLKVEGNLKFATESTAGGGERTVGTAHLPSATSYTGGDNAVHWLELSDALHSQNYLGHPERFVIEVWGAKFGDLGKTTFVVKSRDGLTVKRHDEFGGAEHVTLKIYDDVSESTGHSLNNKYIVGLLVGENSVYRSYNVRARDLKDGTWLEVLPATEPSPPEFNDVTPSIGYTDFKLGKIDVIGDSSIDGNLDVTGSITGNLDGNIEFEQLSGKEDESFKIYHDTNFGGPNVDYLVFDKTDLHTSNPDGGIAFTNTGYDGIRETAMVVRGNGNVGIGTTTPTAKLDVTDGIVVRAKGVEPRGTLNEDEAIRMTGLNSDYIISVQDGTGRIQHYWNSSPGDSPTYLVANENAGKILLHPEDSSSTIPFFALYQAPKSVNAQDPITWNSFFAVDQQGDVGIGTDAPSAKLEVVGDIKSTGSIILENRAGDIPMWGEVQ